LYPVLTARDQQRYDYIVGVAQDSFIQHGTGRLTISQFAYATKLSAVSIRRHVCDMHHLLGLVLHKHLNAIIAAIGRVPHGPDLLARRRAAYFAATRGICDIPTPLHFLLLRDRFALPEDELGPIESQRNAIAAMIAGDNAEDALDLLDRPTYSLRKIEAVFAATLLINQDIADNPTPVRVFDLTAPAPEKPPAPAPIHRPDPRLDPALANLSDAELRDPPRHRTQENKPPPPD
jgi:hypothetical protein